MAYSQKEYPMEEIILEAIERTEKPNKTRTEGFIPGVLSGPGTASASVKFNSAALNKIIAKHGSNAKIWVKSGSEKNLGFIKEIQRTPVDGHILHVTIQIVSKDQEIKMQLPVIFHGHAELEHEMLQLLICKSNVDVIGKIATIPDTVVVDVSEKKAGENVTSADFSLPKDIRILDPEDEVYAVIKEFKEEAVEEEDSEPAAAE